MSDPLAPWFVHDVVVERKTGSSAYGDVLDAPVTVRGFVSDDTRLVVAPDGQQVASSSRVALPASTAPVPVGSWVTLPWVFGARRTEVVAASIGDAPGLPVPSHQEISLR